MRFQRNAKIFRGQIDAAPIAGVFFLLVIFILLHSNLVFTPGIRVDLNSDADLPKSPLTKRLAIDAVGSILYDESTWKPKAFAAKLREDAAKSRAPAVFFYETEPGAKPESIDWLRNLTAELGIQLKPFGSRIDLPDAGETPGTMKPTVLVAVNLSGQIFFENQIIKESALRQKLEEAARRAGGPLALVLQMDKGVDYDTFIRLSRLAREAKISEVLSGTRPRLPQKSDPKGQP